jgi:hypothetical protein
VVTKERSAGLGTRDAPAPAPALGRAPARAHLAALALFGALSVLMTWPLARSAWWASLDYGDTLTTAAGMAWEAHALVTNPAHFFDANIMYPFSGTLTFDEINLGPALLGAPIFWLTGNAILGYNLVTLLSFALSGYGAWLLVRELTGSDRAGVIAGVAFAFSFFRFNNLTHLTILSVQWLPLALLWLRRLWQRPAWPAALLFGGLFALQALSSHYMAFYTAGATALFALYYMIAERRAPRAFLLRLGGALALAGALVAPIAVGYLLGQGGGFHRALWDIERYTATFQGLLAVYQGSPVYQALLAPFADPGAWPWERSLFPGLVAPALAALGVIAAWRARAWSPGRRDALFYALLTAIAGVMAFGPELIPTFTSGPVAPLPYMLVYLFVPGAETMRVITRIWALVTLGLAVLAGFGAAWLLARRAGGRLLRLGAPAALCALLMMEVWAGPQTLRPLPSGADAPPVYRWLAAQPPDTVEVEYPMLYKQRGPRNVDMVSLYEYYSTVHWLRTPNGAMTVRPTAWTGLTMELENCFPCPRSLDVLWALGVQLAVVHRENLTGPQQQDFAWRSTAGRAAGLYPGEFTPVADFGQTTVFRVARAGPNPLANLRAHVRPGATLGLALPADDPERTGAYIDALAYWLRDLRQFGDPDRGFGQPIAPLRPGGYDYALLYRGQDPAPYGFAPADARWQNDYVTLYGRS